MNEGHTDTNTRVTYVHVHNKFNDLASLLVYIFIVTVTTEVDINQFITTKIVRKIPSIAILENEDMRKDRINKINIFSIYFTFVCLQLRNNPSPWNLKIYKVSWG